MKKIKKVWNFVLETEFFSTTFICTFSLLILISGLVMLNPKENITGLQNLILTVIGITVISGILYLPKAIKSVNNDLRDSRKDYKDLMG